MADVHDGVESVPSRNARTATSFVRWVVIMRTSPASIRVFARGNRVSPSRVIETTSASRASRASYSVLPARGDDAAMRASNSDVSCGSVAARRTLRLSVAL